jgi:hypothetical protein
MCGRLRFRLEASSVEHIDLIHAHDDAIVVGTMACTRHLCRPGPSGPAASAASRASSCATPPDPVVGTLRVSTPRHLRASASSRRRHCLVRRHPELPERSVGKRHAGRQSKDRFLLSNFRFSYHSMTMRSGTRMRIGYRRMWTRCHPVEVAPAVPGERPQFRTGRGAAGARYPATRVLARRMR